MIKRASIIFNFFLCSVLLFLASTTLGLTLTWEVSSKIIFVFFCLFIFFFLLVSFWLIKKLVGSWRIPVIFLFIFISTMFLDYILLAGNYFPFPSIKAYIGVNTDASSPTPKLQSLGNAPFELDNKSASDFKLQLGEPKNGLNQLILSLSFNAKITAFYHISAEISTEEAVGWRGTQFERRVLPEGKQNISLTYPIEDFAEKKVNASFLVKNVRILMTYPYDEKTASESSYYDSNSYIIVDTGTTIALKSPQIGWEDFYTPEELPITLLSLGDETVDFDQNGKYDLLLLKPVINVRKEGDYDFVLAMEPNLPVGQIVYPFTHLKTGQQTLTLPIWGDFYSSLNRDGPYEVEYLWSSEKNVIGGKGVSLIDNPAYRSGIDQLGSEERIRQEKNRHLTKPYKVSDFEKVRNYSAWTYFSGSSKTSSYLGKTFSIQYPVEYKFESPLGAEAVTISSKETLYKSSLPAARMIIISTQVSLQNKLESTKKLTGVTSRDVIIDGRTGIEVYYVTENSSYRRTLYFERNGTWTEFDMYYGLSNESANSSVSNIVQNENDFDAVLSTTRWK